MKSKNKTIILVTVITAIIIGVFTFVNTGGLQGKISLKDPISRGEFSKFLAKSLASAQGEDMNAIVSDANCNIFFDVKITASYWPSICYLYLNDIIKDNTNGSFGPSKNISRAEGVKLIMLIYKDAKYPNDEILIYYNPKQAYKDVTQKAWYYTWIQGAASLGITDIRPFENEKFHPDYALTIGGAQNMVNKLNKVLNLSI